MFKGYYTLTNKENKVIILAICMNAYMNEQVWGKRGRQVTKGSHIQRE